MYVLFLKPVGLWILEGLTITNAPTLTLVQLVELSRPKRDLLLVSCINMHYSIKGPLFTLHASLIGTRMMSIYKSVNRPGGLQCIQTLDRYIIPLSIKDGLARLSIRPYTDHKWDSLSPVILTSEIEGSHLS
jgi:hypothetical protein